MNKVYMETDALGEHKVIEKPNGIKIRLLKKPSPEYAAKLKARGEKEKIRMAKEQEQQEQERLIRNKMRELAIADLKKDGKL